MACDPGVDCGVLGGLEQTDLAGKDKESNWLSAPNEPFYMLMRMYMPDIEVLNGQYGIPGVVQGKCLIDP